MGAANGSSGEASARPGPDPDGTDCRPVELPQLQRPDSSHYTARPRHSFDIPLPDRSDARARRAHARHGHPQRHARFVLPTAALRRRRRAPSTRALAMEAEGADIIDIGGESTRPGADAVSRRRGAGARRARASTRLRGRLRVPLSIDTYKAGGRARRARRRRAHRQRHQRAAVRPGAGGGRRPRRGAGRRADAHARALAGHVPRRRTTTTWSREVVGGTAGARSRARRGAASPRDRVLVDPGLGFAKRAEHSWGAGAAPELAAALGRRCWSGPRASRSCSAPIGERAAGRARLGDGRRRDGRRPGRRAHRARARACAEMVQVVRVADDASGASAGIDAGRRRPSMRATLNLAAPTCFARAPDHVVGRPRHRDRVDPDLRGAEADPRHPRRADGARRRRARRLLFYISRWRTLETVNWLIRNIVGYVVFAAIVLFQSDIRRALAHFGRAPFFRLLRQGRQPPTRRSRSSWWRRRMLADAAHRRDHRDRAADRPAQLHRGRHSARRRADLRPAGDASSSRPRRCTTAP